MTSRTRFWAPKPMASPAMPAPVRIGNTSIDSSRSTISIATNQTVTVTRLVRMPPSVLARRCHSRSAVVARCDSRCCRFSMNRLARANDDGRAGDDDDEVHAVGERPSPDHARIEGGLRDAEAGKPERDAAKRRHAEREEPERADQPRRAVVQRLAALRTDDLHRVERPVQPAWATATTMAATPNATTMARMVRAYSGIRAAGSSGSWCRAATGQG